MPKKGIEEGDVIKYGPGKYYRVLKKIGEGGYGRILSAVDPRGKEVVIKVAMEARGRETIETENSVYARVNGLNGFPYRYLYGKFNGEPFIVMKRCGCSVGQFFRQNKVYSDENAARVGLPILSLIEQLHGHAYLHRDIKPDNMLINEERTRNGRKAYRLYLIDFGNAIRYKNGTKFLIKEGDRELCAGTCEFAPPNWHRAKSQSCKDDLLSLAYSLAFLCDGAIPWYANLGRTFVDHEKHATQKEQCTGTKLFPNCAQGLIDFFENIKKLTFYETPDYDQLKENLMSAAQNKL